MEGKKFYTASLEKKKKLNQIKIRNNPSHQNIKKSKQIRILVNE